MSKLSVGSGASSRLIVAFVRPVSFIVPLAMTEMWLKPNSDGPSGQKTVQCIIITQDLDKDHQIKV